MADDPVEAARRRQAAMLRRSSYFPAANLRQFEGTELSPPGGGTYFNPERYRSGGWGGKQYYASELRNIQRNLANQWQSDLTFNAMANPRVAQSLEAERIGAQYGSGPVGSGRATPATMRNYINKYGSATPEGNVGFRLPSGGFAAVAPMVGGKRVSPETYLAQTPFTGGIVGGGAVPGGYAVPDSSRYEALRQTAAGGTPAFLNNPVTPYQRAYAAGYNTPGVERPMETGFGYQLGQGLAKIGTLGYNAIAGLGRWMGNQNTGMTSTADQRYFSYNPSPVPPRRYFDQ